MRSPGLIAILGLGGGDRSRMSALKAALAAEGFSTTRLRPPAAAGDRSLWSRGDWVRFAAGLPRAWLDLTRAALRDRRPWDAILVPYPGHLDVAAAVAIARLRAALGARRPLVVLDLFVSLSETLVSDRRRVAAGSLAARALSAVDRSAVALADLVIADTAEHARAWRAEGLRPRGLVVVPVGADPIFQPRSAPPADEVVGRDLDVVHIGSHIPLHGGATIVAAARLIDAPLRITMIGRGQERGALEQQAGGAVRFEDPIAFEELPARLGRADIALGIFGGSRKARSVVPHKVYQALACGRPLITADTPAQAALLRHGRDAWLVPPEDPRALAAALQALAGDPRLRRELGAAGRRRFEESCGPGRLALELCAALRHRRR